MRHLSLIILLLVSGFWFLVTASPAHAQTSSWLGTNCVGYGDVATIKGIECLVGNVLAIALTGFGLVMFILLLVGGLKYLTAGADQKALESAKATLTWAIGGLVLAVLAWFILQAIQAITDVDVSTFRIGLP